MQTTYNKIIVPLWFSPKISVLVYKHAQTKIRCDKGGTIIWLMHGFEDFEVIESIKNIYIILNFVLLTITLEKNLPKKDYKNYVNFTISITENPCAVGN